MTLYKRRGLLDFPNLVIPLTSSNHTRSTTRLRENFLMWCIVSEFVY